jgi:hypothetical protein
VDDHIHAHPVVLLDLPRVHIRTVTHDDAW